MSLDAKSFDLRWRLVWQFRNLNLEIEETSKIQSFTIQAHGPKMLKILNLMFLDPKTSNLKLLTSCVMPLDAKSFDFGWPAGLEV